MKKYKYLGLVIEMTRKCNLNCVHCMRGDAQNVTITREIIDKIIENVDDCMRFQLTGGEPLLALDELEYLIDRIIERNYSADMIDFVTNGTVQDRRVIDILSRFCRSGKQRKALISISNDQFHNVKQSEETYNFYMDATKDIPEIEIKYNGIIGERKENGLTGFILSGRGKTITPDISSEAIRKESVLDHRICIGDFGKAKGWVMCTLQINATGDVCLMEQRSFDTLDSMAIGNIMDTPLYDLIQRFNSNCLVNCHEVQLLEWFKDYRCTSLLAKGSGTPEVTYHISELIADIAVGIIERVIKARELAHERWPAIPAQDIIESLAIPDIAMIYNDTLQDIIDNSDPVMPGEIDKYITGESKESASKAIDAVNKDVLNSFLFGKKFAEQIGNLLKILVLLKKPGARIAINKFYGNGNVDETEEFRKLARLNEEYMSGKRIYDNSKVLCDMNWNVQEYCERVYLNGLSSALNQTMKNLEKAGPVESALGKMLLGYLLQRK